MPDEPVGSVLRCRPLDMQSGDADPELTRASPPLDEVEGPLDSCGLELSPRAMHLQVHDVGFQREHPAEIILVDPALLGRRNPIPSGGDALTRKREQQVVVAA